MPTTTARTSQLPLRSVLDSTPLTTCAPKHSLASPEGRQRIAKLREELQRNPDKATQFFQEAGILNRKGQLAKRYGG